MPLSRLSLYRDIEDYQWDGTEEAGEDLADPVWGDDDAMFEDKWDDLEANDRNDWSYMEVDEGDNSPEPDDIDTGILLNPVNPVFGNNTKMPGTFPSSPSNETSDSEFRVSSPETKEDGTRRQNSCGSAEEVKMLLIETQNSQVDREDADFDPEMHWKRFDILPDAPHDHAFYSVEPIQPGKAFLTRLSKEYRVLQSSLPDSILVRAYEDRADLMRCLIIGPENTPYEDAPFVIDWRLDESFPQSPPIAHFLSWTNGNGRVNPYVRFNH